MDSSCDVSFYTIDDGSQIFEICQLKEHLRDTADNSPRYKTKYFIVGIVSSVSTDKNVRASRTFREPDAAIKGTLLWPKSTTMWTWCSGLGLHLNRSSADNVKLFAVLHFLVVVEFFTVGFAS